MTITDHISGCSLLVSCLIIHLSNIPGQCDGLVGGDLRSDNAWGETGEERRGKIIEEE